MNTETTESKTPVQRFVMPLLCGVAAVTLLLLLCLLLFSPVIVLCVILWPISKPLSVIVGLIGLLFFCDTDPYFDMPSHV